MKEAVEKVNENATRLGDLGDVLNEKLSAMLVNVDTLSVLHKDERETQQKMYYEAIDKLSRHYKHIIIALILTLIIFIGGVIGTVAYVLTNFDIYTYDVGQSIDIGVDGSPEIQDGIHVNAAD